MYVILGINAKGWKKVLTISVGDNEISKYWLSVLNELKNRGVKDILIICTDGLTGMKEGIATTFPKTEVPALHRPPSQEYPEICSEQRQKSFRHGFKDNQLSGGREESTGGPGTCDRKMNAQIS